MSESAIAELVRLCKCEVAVTVNEHRAYYEPVSEFMEKRGDHDLRDGVRMTMIERNTIVEVQFYPDTPIGSYVIFHYDVDLALDQALEIARGLPGRGVGDV